MSPEQYRLQPVRTTGMYEPPPRPRGKRGPKPKGNRVNTSMALEIEVRQHAQVLADRDGLALCDVINRLCAEALGLPAPPYSVPKDPQDPEDAVQETLPMAEAS